MAALSASWCPWEGASRSPTMRSSEALADWPLGDPVADWPLGDPWIVAGVLAMDVVVEETVVASFVVVVLLVDGPRLFLGFVCVCGCCGRL